MQRIGMTDSRQWQPAVNETPHTIPQDAAVLASPRQRAMPEPPYLEPKDPQRRCVRGHPVVPDVSTHDRLQPSTLLKDGYVHAPPKLDRKSTRLNSSHRCISYAVFCLKKKKQNIRRIINVH